jgi:hypothetical protein
MPVRKLLMENTMSHDTAGESKPIDPAFTILVLGGDAADESAVIRALDALNDKHDNLTVLTSGGLSPVDAVAENWARIRKCAYIGDPRGPDVLVLYLPHGAVCFAGGDDSAANRAGIKVWRPAR